MNISNELFQHYCSSATNPTDSDVFYMIQAEIERAKLFVLNLVGVTIYDGIEDLNPDIINVTNISQRISEAAARYVCNSAYRHAIPHLDLVLTPTGFGIVSNANVVPASAERVENLRKEVANAEDDALDDLIDALRSIPEWSHSAKAVEYIPYLIWKGVHGKMLGLSGHRSDLQNSTVSIAEADARLRALISPEFVDELLTAIRTAAPLGVLRNQTIFYAQTVMAACMTGDHMACVRSERFLLSFIHERISNEEFKTYRNSQTYQSRLMGRYENKQSDSCYFFG